MSSTGTPPLSGAARAKMIAERQRRSPVWKLIHLLASLKLALLLLATIAIACAVATITESHFDSAVAKAWIYKSPWFIAWLGVLCVNLFAVTLSRWPWQKAHTGFIMTHYGIILLLIGAVIGSKLGFEGNVTLRTDGQPQRRVVTDRSCLQIESPADNYLYLLPFDTRFVHPSEKHPIFLPVPGTSLRIGIDAVSEHLVTQPSLIAASGMEAGFAVLMDFSTAMMGQSLSVVLGTGQGSPRSNEFFGRATITLIPDASLFPKHAAPTGSEKPKPWIDLAPGTSANSILYRVGRGDTELSSGSLSTGSSIPLGWADWRLTLKECGANRAVTSTLAPKESGQPAQASEGMPGFRAFLKKSDGKQGIPRWVVSGEVAPLTLDADTVRIGYGMELRSIPFSIALTDFQVPRDEGTETPSDFRASVLFKETKTGLEKSGFIHMNHPASFPGDFMANLTGLNYKFSQAEWNPQDLRETTLQVLYDPGWLYKWMGSLAIVLGIATMFYIRPRKQTNAS